MGNQCCGDREHPTDAPNAKVVVLIPPNPTNRGNWTKVLHDTPAVNMKILRDLYAVGPALATPRMAPGTNGTNGTASVTTSSTSSTSSSSSTTSTLTTPLVSNGTNGHTRGTSTEDLSRYRLTGLAVEGIMHDEKQPMEYSLEILFTVEMKSGGGKPTNHRGHLEIDSNGKIHRYVDAFATI